MKNQQSIKLKEKQVKNLVEDILNSKSLIIASIKNLRSKQLQEIKKSLRNEASIRVIKKNIMGRVIENIGGNILNLKEHIGADCALVTSALDGFELARVLSKNKTPVFAKAGQIALEDIEIKEGPTSLVPGPVISELGSLGLQIAVEEGKISIKRSKVVVKKGEIINSTVASLLQRLNIQPFNIGLKVLVVYYLENGKIYSNIDINSEEYIKNMVNIAGKALEFAKKINYYCKETIGYFLAKAGSHEKILTKFVK